MQTQSTETQRQAEQAMRNRRRLANYYRKRSAFNAITGKQPPVIPYRIRASMGGAA